MSCEVAPSVFQLKGRISEVGKALHSSLRGANQDEFDSVRVELRAYETDGPLSIRVPHLLGFTLELTREEIETAPEDVKDLFRVLRPLPSDPIETVLVLRDMDRNPNAHHNFEWIIGTSKKSPKPIRFSLNTEDHVQPVGNLGTSFMETLACGAEWIGKILENRRRSQV